MAAIHGITESLVGVRLTRARTKLIQLKTLWASPANQPSPEAKLVFIEAAQHAIQKDRANANIMLIYILGRLLWAAVEK